MFFKDVAEEGGEVVTSLMLVLVGCRSLRALVVRSSAPAPGAPSPWGGALGAAEGGVSQCSFLRMSCTAENPHA